MTNTVFSKLHEEGILSEGSLQKVKSREAGKLFSVHWEIKTLLYLGVLLLSGGLGILVYKNIDSIGHQFILLFLALTCGGCFYYCIKKKDPFSTTKVASPNVAFDYLLLLGCLSLLTFIGYLQFQYNVFGNRYGLASFIPMLILFFTAYYFDHLGVLSMAITNLAAWLGITVTPLEILKQNDFDSGIIIVTALLLGTLLIAAATFTAKRKIKAHFEFTYNNFGMHILYISCLAAMFYFNNEFYLLFLLLMGIAAYFYMKALRDKSFYILLVTILYAYIGISSVVLKLIDELGSYDLGPIYLGILYFIASAIGMIIFLTRTNKKLKAK